MRLFGQGSPTSICYAHVRALAVIAACGVLLLGATSAFAVEVDVRIRFAWGSGGQLPQKWHGKITVAGAELSELQPLGIEADEAAALQLVGNEIRVAPLVHRAFDGCDITIRGDEAATIKVELQASPDAPVKVVEATLGQVAGEQLRAAIDDLGGDLLIHRAPGDRLRVTLNREHLVLSPGEPVPLPLTADFRAEAANTRLTISATLHRAGADDILAELTKPYDPEAPAPSVFQFTAPHEEGAYAVKFVVRRPLGLADRLAPWDQDEMVASRTIELVVVDPEARLPRLTGQWEVVSTIDPADTSWWQRLPQWTQFDKLPGFSTPRPLGNVRPSVVAGASSPMVELPAEAATGEPALPFDDGEPAWQAYLLPVRRVGEPHAVEIELPRGVRQHLGVSIVEPDAAGRVTSFGRDCGVYCDEPSAAAAGEVEVHRVVFWPRTKSPALVLSNRSGDRPIQYGRIRLLQHETVESATAASEPHSQRESERLVAAYISTPQFAETLGAAENLDAASGLSVDGWKTFLAGANRLAQHLRAAGYNAAIVSIAADGASLAPIDLLGASPRFDTGPLSAAGADPLRKDVLEVLLRVFDREGLKLIPAVQLAAPLPGLESLAANGGTDIRWRTRDGGAWSEHFPPDSAVAPHYNILHAEVQREVTSIVEELLDRYGAHPSLAGLSLQLDGNGFGVLPGLAWGMDDATTARFVADLGVELPAEGPGRFQQRAAVLLGKHFEDWKNWRSSQLSQFYAGLAARVARDRPELQLVLCTEEALSGPIAGERVRQAVGGRTSLEGALDETGLDLQQLAAAPNIVLFRPRRLSVDASADACAVDHRLNGALELDRAFAGQACASELLFHTSVRVRLPSFDALSPFGAERTYFSLASHSVPSGDAARQALAAALTARDLTAIAVGAEMLPLADNPRYAEALRAFRELPTAAEDVRTERRQPITLRVYRDAESTTICLINESRWPVGVTLPIESEGDLVWRQLGVSPAVGSGGSGSPTNVAGEPSRGALARGPQKIEIRLAPFGIHARRYSSRTMRVGDFTPQLADEAQADMARRVAEIEARMAGLNVERSYGELQNPHFELVDEGGRLRGWQPRIGQRGAVEVAAGEPPIGRSVHLTSEDTLGVAVQSHLFAIPATGQIVVRAKVRGAELKPGAQLYAWVEYESGGAMRQRYVALGDQTLPTTWTERELAVDDLPLGATGNMRVQFHLTGSGQVWIDDVRLYDLRFVDAQRVELSKRLLGAKAALEEGHVMDCQRLVDSYLPRRLLEHVPPPALAAKPDEAAPSTTNETSKGFAPRIRGIVPKILR